MIFSDLDPYPTFQLVLDPTYMFSNILDINFTFVFLPCKCVRLPIMTRYKLFGPNYQILPVFQSSFTSNSFRSRNLLGSGMIFSQDPDPAKSF